MVDKEPARLTTDLGSPNRRILRRHRGLLRASSTWGFLLTSLSLTQSGISGCDYQHDTVAPGYYGQTKAGTGGGSSSMSSAAQGSQGSPSQGQGTGGMSGSSTMPNQSSAGKSAAAGGGGTTALVTGAKSDAGSGEGSVSAGSSGTPPVTTNNDAGTADASAQTGSGSMAAATPCDLSGRWLNTVHYVTDALGALQYAHVFIYLELEQQGDSFTVKRALHCGDDALGGGSLAATVDFKKTWASCMAHISYTGRKGTSVVSGDSCQIDIEKWYTVRGATVPYYLDPSTTLPAKENMAMGDMPGWEDWDGDGNPGITGEISGAVTGKIFVAPRQWTQYTGMVSQADLATKIKLSLMWDQQQNVMGYDGSPFLGTEASRASDATLHFAQFARLTADQVTGDDAAMCASIVQLAPTLTPEAAGM